MRPRTSIALAVACAVGLGTATFSRPASAQQQDLMRAQDQVPAPGELLPRFLKDCNNEGIFGNPPIYFPYPPGIIPRDICKEIKRVRREVKVIFDRYFAQGQALTNPTLTGQPPTLQGTGYEAVRILGGLLNFDENMSVGKDTACSFCHMPYVAFSGPIPSVNLTMIAYPGSYHLRAAKRTAQRYTYSNRFPVLHLNGA
ncbi:MAG: cytochrome c peroxidase, partial [Rhodospirillaceae bacterium]|nr:cytochrome c peroxidase [Rhodospirillaceae bacterium]